LIPCIDAVFEQFFYDIEEATFAAGGLGELYIEE
jgi:hypothetical protein